MGSPIRGSVGCPRAERAVDTRWWFHQAASDDILVLYLPWQGRLIGRGSIRLPGEANGVVKDCLFGVHLVGALDRHVRS